jgi:crotonobetainyl-CoA:carnitine CoA-transferase CaiB-like acyl-CoA transferase
MTCQGELQDQPLAGVTVLELATGIAGPYMGKLFADYGADVIKIEPPGGDEARRWGPFLTDVPDDDISALFLHLNANKRSATLDLAHPSGQDLLRRLVLTTDVCTESFTPGTLAGYGLHFSALRACNPSLILTSITPFGQDGPYRGYRGNEIVYSALSGMNVTRARGGCPIMLGGNLTQYQTGNVAAMATMASLLFLEAGGEGTHVDISHMATQMASANQSTTNLVGYAYTGRTSTRNIRPPGSPRPTAPPTVLPNGAFPCRDGAVWVATLQAWIPRMLKAIDSVDLTAIFRDPGRLNEPQTMDRISALVTEWFLARSRADAMAEAQAAGWPVIAFQSPAEVVGDPHFVERGAILEYQHPVAGPVMGLGPPFQFEDAWMFRTPAPGLGQHTAEVYAQIGLGAAELSAYRAAGVI